MPNSYSADLGCPYAPIPEILNPMPARSRGEGVTCCLNEESALSDADLGLRVESVQSRLKLGPLVHVGAILQLSVARPLLPTSSTDSHKNHGNSALAGMINRLQPQESCQ